MKQICITCCWEELAAFAWLVLKWAFWPVVGYLSVYALGAVAFLANLRAKVGPTGKLVVEWNSWAYMLARPKRYGIIKEAMERYKTLDRAIEYALPEDWFNTSICPIYFRLLNMMLFVWPVLLVYLAAASMLGTLLFGGILGVGYVRPNFSGNAWLELVKLRDLNSWGKLWFLGMPATYYITAFFAIMAAAHVDKLLHGLWLGLLLALCLLPVLGLIAAVIFVSRKVFREKDDGTTKVGLAAEFLASKKEGWCKLVEIK